MAAGGGEVDSPLVEGRGNIQTMKAQQRVPTASLRHGGRRIPPADEFQQLIECLLYGLPADCAPLPQPHWLPATQ